MWQVIHANERGPRVVRLCGDRAHAVHVVDTLAFEQALSSAHRIREGHGGSYSVRVGQDVFSVWRR